MKARINEMFQYPISKELENHILNDLGFKDDDKKIIKSLMYHSGSSNFHYDNTMIPHDKFEYRLKIITQVLFNEMMRLAKIGYEKEYKENINKS